MSGAMRKMAVYLGLVEQDDQLREYDEYEEEYVDDRTRPLRAVRDDELADELTAAAPARHADGRSAHPRPAAASSVSADYRITTLHPRTYNDARAIGEAFRENTPVIMNLTEMDDTDAKRIVDFSAGLVFGLRGSIERVTQKVFLLSPVNVVVTAEDKQRMVQGGFFNQS